MKILPQVVLLLIFAAATIGSAQAVCYKDGTPYQTGDVVNGFKCKADGNWERV